MDSCCLTLKANVSSKGLGFKNGDKEFWGEKIRGSLNNTSGINQLGRSFRAEKNGRHSKPGVVQAVFTSNNAKETLTFQAPRFERQTADPQNVASIILGGGAGTQLFPLTRRIATPAVPVRGSYRLVDIPMSNYINSGINKILVLTQFNFASLNRHLARTYYGNGVNFGDGFVEVLAATQTHLVPRNCRCRKAIYMGH